MRRRVMVEWIGMLWDNEPKYPAEWLRRTELAGGEARIPKWSSEEKSR